MQKKINSNEISVIVQGAVNRERTKKTLVSIRKNLPDAEIILSTWEGSNVEGLEYDVLILNKDPGAVLQKKGKKKKFYSNINRMIFSTNNGIKKAERKYILKLRSDASVDSTAFLEAFDKFPERCDRYKLFNHRILASTLFSKFSLNNKLVKSELPFHVSDWWFFGLAEDVKKLLLSAELVEEPYFSNYFEYPDNQNKNSIYELYDWKFAPEQYIGYSCFSKYYDDIRMDDCSDISASINEKSQICLANNFIFLEYKQSGISNLKYLFSKNEVFSGELYLDLYSFYKFELEYKKYCDSAYMPVSKSLIHSDREKGTKILKFYKHLFKLIDPEVSLRLKIEQVFLGIPFSAINLLPTLISILFDKFKTK